MNPPVIKVIRLPILSDELKHSAINVPSSAWRDVALLKSSSSSDYFEGRAWRHRAKSLMEKRNSGIIKQPLIFLARVGKRKNIVVVRWHGDQCINLTCNGTHHDSSSGSGLSQIVSEEFVNIVLQLRINREHQAFPSLCLVTLNDSDEVTLSINLANSPSRCSSQECLVASLYSDFSYNFIERVANLLKNPPLFRRLRAHIAKDVTEFRTTRVDSQWLYGESHPRKIRSNLFEHEGSRPINGPSNRKRQITLPKFFSLRYRFLDLKSGHTKKILQEKVKAVTVNGVSWQEARGNQRRKRPAVFDQRLSIAIEN